MEQFKAQPGDIVETTEISPLRGPFSVLSVYMQAGFCYYEVAQVGQTEKISTLRNKDIKLSQRQYAAREWTIRERGEIHDVEKQLNVCLLDVDSYITNYGAHSRVVAFCLDRNGLYCRVDLTKGLRVPTVEEVLRVAEKTNGERYGKKWRVEAWILWGKKQDKIDVEFKKHEKA